MPARPDAPTSPITSRSIRALPVILIRPDATRLPPSAITDAATKAAVDAKLNAALKELIKQAIGSTDPAVGKLVDGLSLDYHALLSETILSVIKKMVVPAMVRQPALATLAAALEKRSEVRGAPTIKALLQPDVPLSENPLFVDDVRQGKGRELLRIASLDEKLLAKIDAGRKQLEAWNDFDWDNAVQQNILTPAQRDNLFFTAELSRLTGEQYGLVDAARKAALNSVNDLVQWDQTRWLDLMRRDPTSIPSGVAPEAFANQLAKSVQQTFPSEYFSHRITDKTLAQSAPLVFRHLGLDKSAGRLDALGRFLQNNAAEDLRFINLLDPNGAVNWTGIAAADQAPVRNQLLAYQRVLHLSQDHDTAMALLRTGLDSSTAIGTLSYSSFIQQTGLDDASGAPVYEEAQAQSARIAHGVQFMKDAISPLEHGRHFQGLDPSFVNELKDIPGYAELFGNTSFCDCEHCRSIFSPAAYFTDLMYFIEKNITQKAFAGKANHPLRLNMRRPDLWKLPLTCANTDTLIPHLTLVNEILESHLTHSLGISNVTQTLGSDRSAIGLPFHAPLAVVREYLSDWNIDLSSLYALLNASDEVVLKETLHLSDNEWIALVAVAVDTAWIKFPSADHTQIDALEFLRLANLSRAQLDELQYTKIAGGFSIVRVNLTGDIQSETEVVHGLSGTLLDRIGRFLRLARKTGWTLTELDEILQSSRITDTNPFSAKALAGVARFKRLQQQLGLSVESLIGVLDHIPVRSLRAGAKSLADQLGITALTSTGGFPVTFHHAHFNTSNSADATVDPRLPALLNLAGVVESELLALFTQYAEAFPFEPNGNCQLTANSVALLYAHVTLARAWRLSPGALSLVVNKLFNIPGNDFRSLDLLEQLRQSMVTLQSLPLPIADTFALLDPATVSITPDQVVSLVSNVQRSDSLRFGPGVLTSVTALALTSADAADILAQLLEAKLIETAGDKYQLTAAYLPNTDLGAVLLPRYTASKDGIHAALMMFHFVNLLPNTLAATAGMSVDKTLVALAFALPGWDAAPLLKALQTSIENGMPTTPTELAPLVALVGDLARLAQLFSRLQLETEDLWLVSQYPALFGIEDLRALRVSDMAAIWRYRQLLSSSTLTAAETKNLLWQYQVRANGNHPLAPFSVFSVAIATVPIFAQALASADRATLQPAAAPAFSSEALVASPLDANEITLVANGMDLNPMLLRSLFLSQKLPAVALDGITRALSLYSFCRLIGVQGASLGKLLARDAAGLEVAGKLLWDLLQNKYRDSAPGDQSLAPHTSALNMLLRDAQCDYIIARSDMLKFRGRDDLYNYFLIDVEMGGCFETSRLVAALSSLQLYVYRCLVDLEQSASDNLSVLPLIDADDISKEWEWRKNYRVWEANRKVFLYPENYLEPELRDNKTSLFKELEESLLQRKITLDAAADAYNRYLVGFSVLAQLKVVGVCFDGQGYWFIGRTHLDPYQYFLRRYHRQANRWDSWEKIELGIGSPYASPLVHRGRLYLFWVEISSMDKTSFADGNSVFHGIEHQVTLHYSHREPDGKWAPAQKKVLLDKIIDRYLSEGLPPWFSGSLVSLLSVDKEQTTSEMVKYYQGSKTYAKVMLTEVSGEPDRLTVHYFRKFKRSNLVTADSARITDGQIDQMFVVGGTKLADPNPQPCFEYFGPTLDLLSNELLFDSDSYDLEDEGEATESVYHDFSNGVQAVGILLDDSIPSSFSLVLGTYAEPGFPSATDDMLITSDGTDRELVTGSLPAHIAHDMLPVSDRQEETVLQHGRHQHWIKLPVSALNAFGRRIAVRVNTTLAGRLSGILFSGGLDQFLTLATQTTGEEPPQLHAIQPREFGFASDKVGQLPFSGSFGDYYRELFFHIPFLIANQLNAQGQYAEAKYWYEKIFNPTASQLPNDANPKNRIWQYLEFHNVNVPKLKELLTDQSPIDQYQDDPFNPHAIARLRLSAYQKAIVMKYVSNLVAWADELFTQDTMESVNEATMLYVLAADILGPRPVSVGKCTTAAENTLTYDELGPAIEKGSEFLMFIENIYRQFEIEANVRQVFPVDNAATNSRALSATLRSTGLGSARSYQVRPRLPRYGVSSPVEMAPPARRRGRPGRPDIVRQYLPAFCVPANETLLGYWDRIDDRLFKIRNCLNINGERVSLALFQPPIDPMLLVRAKAAGLSIEDIVGQQNEALPAYRFSYLVEKARQYVSTVQSLGGALLSALEKSDAEQLTLLRSTHEQNILSLQRSMKQQQIADAQAQLAGLQSAQQNVQNRIAYYEKLIDQGLNAWESTEQLLRHTATAFRIRENLSHIMAGIAYLIPQIGSPFALKFGGKELGDSASAQAEWFGSMATVADAGSASAGLEATFQRRTQEWEQQLTLAREEMKQLTKQVLASEIRVQIATTDLDVHEKQIEQAQEIHDFYRNKFTNVALYTFMTAQLTRLYREAYQMAAQVARQAERAYQFERDATDFFIQSDNWQADKSGLLAGERLLLQLQRLEKSYMESNPREIEVSQSFSLLQINPAALQDLQQSGKCSFALPEILFDLQYPGQYRRLLKSVRLTLPCVTGPYTNVGATLRLGGSQVRRVAKAGLNLSPPEGLLDVPLTMTRTIATSHAQNDAGVFDLNFRDERYLPFEGAGAVSQWSLELPSKIRMFDYGSLSDVVINLSYLARHDGAFGDTVESNIVADLTTYAQQYGLFRLVSLRHEFPDAFHQLLSPLAGQPQQTTFTLERRHFPFWLDGMTLQTVQVVVWPIPVSGQIIDVVDLSLKVAGIPIGNWTSDGKGSAIVTGSPIRSWAIDAGVGGLDKPKLQDLLVLVKYTLS